MKNNIGAIFSVKDEFSGKIQGIIDNTKQSEKAFDSSSSSIKDFGNESKSGFGKIASGAASLAGAIGLTKAVAGAFNMVKDSLGGATKRIDTMEQFDRTMTTITGSAEKSAEALAKTTEAVTGTGYGLDVAAKSVQDFVTRGMDIEKATDVVETWGDAVAFYGDGSNDQLERVTNALGKMTSKGKVDMMNMNTLFDAGIDGVGMYAKATGQSTADVEKAMSSGKLGAEDFVTVVTEAMANGTNGVENITGAAKEAGASWGAAVDNMKARITIGVTNVISSIDEMLEDNGLPTMREMIENFGDTFRDTLNTIADNIPVITEKIAEVYNFIKDNWTLIAPVITGITGALVAYKAGTILASAWTSIMSVKAKVLTATQGGLTTAQGLLNVVMAANPMALVAIGIGALIAIGAALWMNWDKIKEKTQELWDKFKETTAFEILESVFESLGNGVEKVGNFFQGVKDKFISFKDAILNFKVPKWVSTIGGAFTTVKEKVFGKKDKSYAVGTDSVPYDMNANIHKGEMIIPAKQSETLRRQGIGIDNIDKGKRNKVVKGGNSITIAKLADQIVVREESDIDKIAKRLARELQKAQFNMA